MIEELRADQVDERIGREILYVRAVYPDDSEVIFRTTLAGDILEELGCVLSGDSLPMIDEDGVKNYFPIGQVEFKFYDEKPVYTRGLDSFASRFIPGSIS